MQAIGTAHLKHNPRLAVLAHGWPKLVPFAVDEELERENRNPAPKFRTARLERDTKYIEWWVRGCKFEWL